MRCMLFPLLKIRDASPSNINETKKEDNVMNNKISEMVWRSGLMVTPFQALDRSFAGPH